METIYTSKKIQIKKTVYSVVIASGQSNYVSIRKETSNPFKTLGKQFANFDEAINNYKSPAMKMELILIQTGIN